MTYNNKLTPEIQNCSKHNDMKFILFFFFNIKYNVCYMKKFEIKTNLYVKK